MEQIAIDVLNAYHERLKAERAQPRESRLAGVSRDNLMLAVGPDTGQVLNSLAGSLPQPNILELGTSFGYSTLWLADGARRSGGKVTTIEQLEHKSAYAKEQLRLAGLDSYVEFIVGDALEVIDSLPQMFDLVLVDLWKDLYVPCLERFYPKLKSGAIVVADNIIRPGGENARAYQNAIRSKAGMQSVLLPVGTGIEISRLEQ
ncbi:O-methyltransferase [Paraburkholderia bannensis]|uniref:O-methyltransferase n=1 Tax=Paraburkholderia bannensis TaxID=765414 RepID=UPI002AC35851|nr:O-methyltransferase [Paraburkholderia bannensis]